MPAQRISLEKRASILAGLCEGLGVNATCRITKTGKPNLLRFLKEAAEACEDWHNRTFRGLAVNRIEIDEQWAYVHTHKERMTQEQRATEREKGDCWLWAALDADSKAVITWKTAKRSMTACHDFSKDLASRIDGRVQVTSDALTGYRYAIPSAFGNRVDYAIERKEFLHDPKEWKPDANYLRKRVDPLKSVTRRKVKGSPDLATATVCHVERFFLTTRQQNKRLTRKTLGYSKVWDNHSAMNTVLICLYNLVRRHESLSGLTPAQALGVTDRRWFAEDVVKMIEAYHAKKALLPFAPSVSRYTERQRPRRVYAKPVKLTPWYLDPESGGKNCPVEMRKPGVNYGEC